MSYGLSLQYCYDTGQIRETLANLTDMARVWKAQGRSGEAAETIAAVLQRPEIDQNALFRPASIGEEAEALRTELEAELEPDVYQEAWERGSGKELEDLVIRILK